MFQGCLSKISHKCGITKASQKVSEGCAPVKSYSNVSGVTWCVSLCYREIIAALLHGISMM